MSLKRRLAQTASLKAMFVSAMMLAHIALAFVVWAILFERPAAARHRRNQQMREASEAAAKAVLERFTRTRKELLRDPESVVSRLGSDATLILVRSGEIKAFPRVPLPWVPDRLAWPGREAPSQLFDEADRQTKIGLLRLAERNLSPLTRSPDLAIRAGALVRRARVRAKVGETVAALNDYQAAARLRDVAIGRFPAELLARLESIELQFYDDGLKHHPSTVAKLCEDLLNGSWRISSETFTAAMGRIPQHPRFVPADEMAQGPMKRTHAKAQGHSAHGLTSVTRLLGFLANNAPFGNVEGTTFIPESTDTDMQTLLRVGPPDSRAALSAGRRFMESEWLMEMKSIEQAAGVTINLTRGATPSTFEGLRLSREDTHLPWDLLISDARDPDFGGTTQAVSVVVGSAIISFAMLAAAASLYRRITDAQSQDTFLAAVSHEIRTPLTAIRQISEMLVDGRTPSQEQQRAYFGTMVRQTARLERTTESLLAFARFEVGDRSRRMAPVVASDLIARVTHEFEQDPAARQHRFILEVGSVSLVSAHEESLAVAIWNLLDNAAKYSPGGSTIHVRVRDEPKHVLIEVCDEGPGILCSERRLVVKKFVRGRAAATSRVNGSGIGLTLVKHVAELHRGTVLLENAHTGGLKVVLRFPRLRSSTEQPA